MIKYTIGPLIKIYRDDELIDEIKNRRSELADYAAVLNCLVLAKPNETVCCPSAKIINEITLRQNCAQDVKVFRDDCELLWKKKLVRFVRCM